MISKQIIMRWIKYGTKGVKLEATKFGLHWRTSDEALQRFGDRQTPNCEPAQAAPTMIPSQRQRQNEAAKAALEEALGVRRCESCQKQLKTGGRAISKTEKLWCPECLIKLPSVSMAKRIRTFRWDAEITQDQLVEKAGFRLQLIRDFELGRKKPTPDQLQKLVNILGPDLVSGLILESES